MGTDESGEAGQGLSLAACLGGITGLILGVIVAMLASAGLYHWMPESQAAEICWEISAPLLGVLGVIAGSAAAHHLLRKRVWLALAGFIGVLAVGLILAFWLVGFPFRNA
jgi:hypothetical protein